MVELVSTVSDLSFLLSDNPEMIRRIKPQQVLHAVLPDTAGRNKLMPKGSSHADMWMLKHGNPLDSVDAALYLVRESLGASFNMIELVTGIQNFSKLHVEKEVGEFSVYAAESETLPGAIVLSLLKSIESDGVAVL
jgi:hypothetical protein